MGPCNNHGNNDNRINDDSDKDNHDNGSNDNNKDNNETPWELDSGPHNYMNSYGIWAQHPNHIHLCAIWAYAETM